MVLYNVTISIDVSCEREWLDWMREVHIPDVIKTGFFKEAKICRLIGGEEEGGKTYAVMYTSYTKEGLEDYKKNHAPKLQLEHNAKFLGKFAAFRSELRVLQEFIHES